MSITIENWSNIQKNIINPSQHHKIMLKIIQIKKINQ